MMFSFTQKRSFSELAWIFSIPDIVSLKFENAIFHPKTKDEWVKLFKQTFRFTGGEIVNEFLVSTGYLQGAHTETCPVYKKVMKQKPKWAEKIKY